MHIIWENVGQPQKVHLILKMSGNLKKCIFIIYPARARSARARRACALRALGLLLADSAPTVGGGGRLFDGSTKFFLRKQL